MDAFADDNLGSDTWPIIFLVIRFSLIAQLALRTKLPEPGKDFIDSCIARWIDGCIPGTTGLQK
jgi:hypothetical protein